MRAYTCAYISARSASTDRRMAGHVVADVSPSPGEEESGLKTNLATSDLHDSAHTLSPGDGGWAVRNGSLPVAVPTANQAGAGLHIVESSTTDSGVSNASSVTSDSVDPPMAVGEEDEGLTAAELRLGLREVEKALEDLDEGARGEGSSGCEGEEVSGGVSGGQSAKRGGREGEYVYC